MLRSSGASIASASCPPYPTPMNDDIQKAFHEAVRNNDVETARRMIAAGADVNAAYDEYENRSLLDACYQGNLDCVKMLVEAGADVNLPDSCGCVPLIRAIVSIHNTDDIIPYLIMSGADVNWVTGEFGTPLQAAVYENDKEFVKLLLRAGANPNIAMNNEDVPLVLATNHESYDIVTMLLRAGANPNIADKELGTALSIARKRKDYRTMEELLKFGAQFENQDNYYSEEILNNINDHPLFCSMKDNSHTLRTDDAAVILYAKHACSYLLRKALETGANPNSADATGKSALVWALEHPRHPQGCAIRLIQHGATFAPELLIYAVRNRMRELVAALLKARADVNVQDERGNSALHYATRKNATFLVQDLIAAGADIEVRNNANVTPLLEAVQSRSLESGSILLEAGANPYTQGGKHNMNAHELGERHQCRISDKKLFKLPWNQIAKENLVPFRFYCAARAGNSEKVRKLVEEGYDINAYDSEGYTALHMSVEYEDSITPLISNGANMYAETKDSTGDSPAPAPAIAASFSLRTNFVKFLDYGYDVNHIDSEGMTLLMHCALWDWEWGARTLLERGADSSIRDKAGQTALFYVCGLPYVCYDEIIDTLLEYGADINATDNDGNTALLRIANEEIEGDRTHLALIGRGIDVNIRNNAGETALSIARKHGHEYLIRELLAAGATDN